MTTDRSRPVTLLFVEVLFCLVALATLAVAQTSHSAPPSSAKTPDVAHQLWTAVVDPALQGPLQSSSQAYYAGELLMVPLHAAFHLNDVEWERKFSEHFQRVVKSPDLTDVTLSRLQYLYLASRFLALAKSFDRQELVPAGLPDFVYGEVRAIWYERSAAQYAHPPFSGMRSRVLFKLNSRNLGKSYYRAILDDELFEFAIAADLRAYGGTSDQQGAWKSTLDDILSTANAVYKREITRTPSGGWLLQPGAWADHPDFQYAGNPRPQHGLRPAPVSDIAWDSSHSFRLPLWISSMIGGFPSESKDRDYYMDLREGLAKQFFAKILVPPSQDFPCYRMNNFMDGRNGVYRWGYGSLGADNGYGPYQVSGSLLFGWWAFLRSSQSTDLYRNLASQFPWPKQCIELYLGPNTGGRPYTDKDLDSNSSAMRVDHLLVILASQLAQ